MQKYVMFPNLSKLDDMVFYFENRKRLLQSSEAEKLDGYIEELKLAMIFLHFLSDEEKTRINTMLLTEKPHW